MLIDARKVPGSSTVEADVCIIGAGAAGIAIAREFADRKTSICLLESGGFEFDEKTQSLYEGYQGGSPSPYPMNSRLRFFGGSTNHWNGFCRPLDDIDFEQRSWVPHSGWPFAKSLLQPHYDRALPLVEIKPFARDDERSPDPERQVFPVGDGARVETKIYHFSPPTRFGEAYRKEIVGAGNISLYLWANAVELKSNSSGKQVEEVEVACLSGNRFRARARLFILAAGGIENARLLLLSKGAHGNGLGNQHGLVGRFFMEHPHVRESALVLITRPAGSMGLYDVALEKSLGHRTQGILCIREDVQRAERLLNFTIELARTPYEALPGFSKDIIQTSLDVDNLQNPGRPKSAFLAHAVARQEQSPNPESRVTLTGELDALGKNKVNVDWRINRGDAESMMRSLDIMGRELGRATSGRVQILIDRSSPWRSVTEGNHHLGTTRMHPDQRQGVVDQDSRVHGMANLYVAGSSVFPTSGFANPTLTILALALRLADHVKGRLGR